MTFFPPVGIPSAALTAPRFGQRALPPGPPAEQSVQTPHSEPLQKSGLIRRAVTFPLRLMGRLLRGLLSLFQGSPGNQIEPAQAHRPDFDPHQRLPEASSPTTPSKKPASIHLLSPIIGSRSRIESYVQFLNSQHPQALSDGVMPIEDLPVLAKSIGVPLDPAFIDTLFDGDEQQFMAFFNKAGQDNTFYASTKSMATMAEILAALDKLMVLQAKRMPLDTIG